MLCDICKKKKATVHLTEIINDDMTEMHLCEECAKSKGNQMHHHFSIASLLSGLVDFPPETEKKEHIKIKCANCGMSYSDFKKLGRFGCARCYEAFRRALYPLLKRIHGTTHHVGKQPGKPSIEEVRAEEPGPKAKPRTNELEGLKVRLAKAIANEEFEEAVLLRDNIRALEAKDKAAKD